MNKESFSFVVYMIHACANKWNMMPSEVYRKMQSVGCIAAILCRILIFCIHRGQDIL